MKRLIVLAVLITGLVAAVTVAEAAVKKGTFTGKSSEKDPMGLKVNKDGKVYAFYFDGVHLSCTDGDALDSPTGASRIQTPNSVKIKVDSKRKFAIHFNGHRGLAWDASGKFKNRGSTVTGTLAIRAKFNEQNELDENGSIICNSSQGLTYSLARKVSQRQG